MIDVEQRWIDVCTTFGAVGAPTAAAWQSIADAYGETSRRYHTLDHIQALLALSDLHCGTIVNPVVFDLAIILHDVVYDPRRTDNELASALWARRQLTDLGLAADAVGEVAHFIEVSRHREEDLATVDPDSDLARFLDFDLAVLAAPADDYAAYATAIRAEYATFPDEVFRPGRAKVLNAFLQRPRIYVSQHGRETWEVAARNNLEAECRCLTGATPRT